MCAHDYHVHLLLHQGPNIINPDVFGKIESF